MILFLLLFMIILLFLLLFNSPPPPLPQFSDSSSCDGTSLCSFNPKSWFLEQRNPAGGVGDFSSQISFCFPSTETRHSDDPTDMKPQTNEEEIWRKLKNLTNLRETLWYLENLRNPRRTLRSFEESQRNFQRNL
ncbi:unnamed protein product [Pleuronectes platessa]|uniref:Uncharacterized protein n=1 Tax=Pleuronectes platessa TaxID=8262 RepID=A0A9N7VNN9_PLEPL|nr:unnamed protein product [Pleuronectes platessa]